MTRVDFEIGEDIYIRIEKRPLFAKSKTNEYSIEFYSKCTSYTVNLLDDDVDALIEGLKAKKDE